MQLHTGAEHFGNVIFRYSELTPQYHFDASIDVKGTVPRDFRLLFFFMNQFPPSP
jgi:hypothetical protein